MTKKAIQSTATQSVQGQGPSSGTPSQINWGQNLC